MDIKTIKSLPFNESDALFFSWLAGGGILFGLSSAERGFLAAAAERGAVALCRRARAVFSFHLSILQKQMHTWVRGVMSLAPAAFRLSDGLVTREGPAPLRSTGRVMQSILAGASPAPGACGWLG